MWIKYADFVDDPADIFKFMYSKGIGKLDALMYMAWALVAERRANYAFADKVYRRGIARGAAPLDRLKLRHREFTRRMSRMWLAHCSAGGDDLEASAIAEHADAAMLDMASKGLDLEALSKAQRHSGHDRQPSDASEPAAMVGRKRAALGAISSDQVTGPRAARAQPGGPARLIIDASGAHTAEQPAAAGFSIFCDAEAAAPAPAALPGQPTVLDPLTGGATHETGQWKQLGTHGERVKENTLETERMAGTALEPANEVGRLLSSAHLRARAPTPAAGTEPFAVFQDEHCPAAGPAEPARGGASHALRAHQPTEDEVRRADPLAAHNGTKLDSSVVVAPAEPARYQPPAFSGKPCLLPSLLVGVDGTEQCFEMARAAAWLARRPSASVRVRAPVAAAPAPAPAPASAALPCVKGCTTQQLQRASLRRLSMGARRLSIAAQAPAPRSEEPAQPRLPPSSSPPALAATPAAAAESAAAPGSAMRTTTVSASPPASHMPAPAPVAMPPPAPAPAPAADDDVTINTRLAAAELAELFGAPGAAFTAAAQKLDLRFNASAMTAGPGSAAPRGAACAGNENSMAQPRPAQAALAPQAAPAPHWQVLPDSSDYSDSSDDGYDDDSAEANTADLQQLAAQLGLSMAGAPAKPRPTTMSPIPAVADGTQVFMASPGMDTQNGLALSQMSAAAPAEAAPFFVYRDD